MRQTIIEVTDLTKRFKENTVLNKISFRVFKGDIFGLTGKNGAGKTTLAYLLLGLILPDSGEIKIFNKKLEENLSEIRSKVNFVSPYVRLNSELTVRQNLSIYADLYSVSSPEDKISKLTSFFGIEDCLEKKVKKLSSGQNTRVMLAKAFLNDPEIVFFDEPTLSLDRRMATKLLNYIKRLNLSKTNTTIFYVSPDPKFLSDFCSRIACMRSGKIYFI